MDCVCRKCDHRWGLVPVVCGSMYPTCPQCGEFGPADYITSESRPEPGVVLSSPTPVPVTSGPIIGPYTSGYQHPPRQLCGNCGKVLGQWGLTGNSVTVTGCSGLYHTVCWDCAGYGGPQSGGFGYGAEKYIRMGTPFRDETPWQVVVDWLNDHGKGEAATVITDLHREPGDE